MDCNDLRSHITEYLYGECCDRVAREIDAHLQKCDQCRRQIEEARSVINLYRELPATPPPAGAVAHAIEEGRKARPAMKKAQGKGTRVIIKNIDAGRIRKIVFHPAFSTVAAVLVVGIFAVQYWPSDEAYVSKQASQKDALRNLTMQEEVKKAEPEKELLPIVEHPAKAKVDTGAIAEKLGEVTDKVIAEAKESGIPPAPEEAELLQDEAGKMRASAVAAPLSQTAAEMGIDYKAAPMTANIATGATPQSEIPTGEDTANIPQTPKAGTLAQDTEIEGVAEETLLPAADDEDTVAAKPAATIETATEPAPLRPVMGKEMVVGARITLQPAPEKVLPDAPAITETTAGTDNEKITPFSRPADEVAKSLRAAVSGIRAEKTPLAPDPMADAKTAPVKGFDLSEKLAPETAGVQKTVTAQAKTALTEPLGNRLSGLDTAPDSLAAIKIGGVAIAEKSEQAAQASSSKIMPLRESVQPQQGRPSLWEESPAEVAFAKKDKDEHVDLIHNRAAFLRRNGIKEQPVKAVLPAAVPAKAPGASVTAAASPKSRLAQVQTYVKGADKSIRLPQNRYSQTDFAKLPDAPLAKTPAEIPVTANAPDIAYDFATGGNPTSKARPAPQDALAGNTLGRNVTADTGHGFGGTAKKLAKTAALPKPVRSRAEEAKQFKADLDKAFEFYAAGNHHRALDLVRDIPDTAGETKVQALGLEVLCYNALGMKESVTESLTQVKRLSPEFGLDLEKMIGAK